MKYLKLLAICLLPLSFVACSDDDDNINTGEATVAFQSASMEIKENTSLVEIPVVVSGEQNGDIKVTAKMISSSNDYVSGKDVIITTENFVIAEDETSFNLEAHLVGLANDAIESGRNITFEITDVEGATLGANATCVVNLKENNPLEGTYTLRGYSPFDGAVVSTKCALSMEEGVSDKAYIDLGWGGALQINLEEVVAGKKYNVTIPGAQVVGAYGSYGNVLFVSAFVDWNAGAVQAFSDDITGVFENGVITLDAEEDYGVGEYIPGAGWLGAYLSYVDAEGNLVPVKFVKQ
ncbi:MAG: hypothetical protein IJZ68_11170 [Bacteroidaceae bacterium]|nr:hypothetical protein [Bacteroidaceae bacterium]